MDTPLNPTRASCFAFADHLELMFGTEDQLFKNEPHVKVWRRAEGGARYFGKQYLRRRDEQGQDIGLSFWTNREFTLLNELQGRRLGRRLGRVQQYRSIVNLGPEGQQLETLDAGPDCDQWQQVPVSRAGHRLAHPFLDCGHWFGLGRWLLAALEEVHGAGLVHVDLKADNYCLPAEWDDTAADGYPARIRLKWERLKLIDFAFSVWENRVPLPANMPLPIGESKELRYQSEQLLAALRAGSGPTSDLVPTRKLDWRVDLYSLGFGLGQILREVEKRCLPDDGNWGWTEKRAGRPLGPDSPGRPGVRPAPATGRPVAVRGGLARGVRRVI